MTYTSYPFDSKDTTEAQYSALFRELQDSGVAGGYASSGLAVTGNSTGMAVSLAPGAAIVRGFFFNNDATAQLPIGAASATVRYDAVILRLDPGVDSIVPVVVANAGQTPVLTQTDTGIYEILLAIVTVNTSAVTIAATDVADKRRFVAHRVQVWDAANRPAAPRAYQPAITPDQGGRLATFHPTDGWVSRIAHHWGSGTTFPTTGMVAMDTYAHTGLQSLMRWNGAAWRQVERAELNSKAAQDAIVANYSSLLYGGFEVYRADQAILYRYSAGQWFVDKWSGTDRTMGGAGVSVHGVSSNVNIPNQSPTAIAFQNVYLPSGACADLFNYLPGNGAVVTNRAGKVQVRAIAVSDSPVGGYSRIDIQTNAPQFGASSPITASQRGPGTYAGFGFLVQELTATYHVQANDYFIMAVTQLAANGGYVAYNTLNLEVTYV